MIRLENISKVIGHRSILRKVDLYIQQGEWLGIIGQNGAGKTTLLKIIAQLSRSTGGRILYREQPLDDGSVLKKEIGVVLEASFLYSHLTVIENLEFYGKLYDVDHLRERIMEVLELLGLEHARKQIFCTLSKGMKQRVSIARAILHQPRILLLDEPFDGLDEDTLMSVKRLFTDLHKKRTTILMVSHALEDIWELCGRVAVLHEGEIIHEYVTALEPLDAIRRKYCRVTAGG
ncbi:ABC transporter ATP-binding protein [Collibacillus ludicampi]|uniref:ABC transporter ATP-binding protein n=1 Tax=Collibacillus ludicampi TaxID=2771369 RepID=A0AAV4LBM0_9BACL|nr:ABC transporter ATP-binding protein [Collibacillus ludicampi]GIM44877.1 ABC transporter ATP-binding protein [Collibacillus ludicampi]